MKVSTAKLGLFELRDEWLTRPIDNDHVAVLVGVLEDGGELPPLSVVTLESGALAVVDGNHRYAAYGEAGRNLIPYRIVGDGESSILWWLAAANNAHGKNRSHEEKRDAVKRAIEAPEGADQSNTGIARHCGVNVDLVRKIREEVRGTSSAKVDSAERASAEAQHDPAASVSTIARRAGVDRKTARKALDRARSGGDVMGNHDVPSRPEPPVTDEAPLPFEPEWYAIAESCERLSAAIVGVKRACSRDLGQVPGGQEIAELLTRAHGIATRRKPQACPSPECAEGCAVCGGRGYTLGAVEGWEGIVAAAGRAHA